MTTAARVAVLALATATIRCATAPPQQLPMGPGPSFPATADKPKPHMPVLLRGEEPRLAVFEYRNFCGGKGIVLLALFDTRLAYRLGDPCAEGDRAYRVVEPTKEEWNWVDERLDFNPLISGSPPEVDYCPNCIGGRHYILILKRNRGGFGAMKLHNPCSGNPSQAQFPTAKERYGAEAAEGLLCSVDRLVDALPGRFPPPRSEPWPKDEPVYRGFR